MPPTPTEGSTSLEAIYRKHQGLVRWVLRARGMSEAVLDDGVHDVFVAIARRLPDRDPAVPLRTWVAGVARNVGFSHRRSMARQRSRAVRMPPSIDPPRPDELFERREAWHALASFLDELGPEQREVFVMVEVTGMRVAELADTMGMPANTLHSRLKAARTRFSQRFGASIEQPAELMRRAREQGRAEPRQRRSTWAAIVVSTGRINALPTNGSLAPASGTAAWGLGSSTITAVVLAAGVLGAAAVVGSWMRPSTANGRPKVAGVGTEAQDRPSPPVVPQRSPSPTGSEVVPVDPRTRTLVEPFSASPAPRSRAPSRERSGASPTAPRTEDTVASPVTADVSLDRATAVLRQARADLENERAREALEAIDGHDAPFGALERERRRLELDAACRLGDAPRTRRVVDALVRLGASIDPERPCRRAVD